MNIHECNEEARTVPVCFHTNMKKKYNKYHGKLSEISKAIWIWNNFYIKQKKLTVTLSFCLYIYMLNKIT